MNFEIPKEIRSKPKMFGLEIKELIILLIGFFLLLTVLGDMVHGMFVIPFTIIGGGLLLWLVMPSRNNPMMKNYMSFILFFKHDRNTYHALDSQKLMNDLMFGDEGVDRDE